MSYLPESYREANYLSGHQYDCGYGAGADCFCGKYNMEAGHARNCSWGMPDDGECDCGKDAPTLPQWAVTAQLPTGRFAIELSPDFDTMANAAKGYAKGGWKAVKLTRINTAEELEQADCQTLKVADWASD